MVVNIGHSNQNKKAIIDIVQEFNNLIIENKYASNQIWHNDTLHGDAPVLFPIVKANYNQISIGSVQNDPFSSDFQQKQLKLENEINKLESTYNNNEMTLQSKHDNEYLSYNDVVSRNFGTLIGIPLIRKSIVW